MDYHYNLSTLFSRICLFNKNNNAIKYQDGLYTYQKLDEDASKVASILLSQDIKRGDVIAIINSKEYSSYVLMLACIKIGVIYTNIDPESPSERFKNTIQTCVPARIFTDHQCSQQLIEASHTFGVEIEDINPLLLSHQQIDSEKLSVISQGLDGDAIAYIMFTSGSTGKPKGVAITHQNLIHFINWGVSHYQITSDDKVANVNPMFFDNSVFDFYVSLFSGACLIPIKKVIVSSAKLLVEYIDQMGCTILFSVPSLFIYLVTMRVLSEKSFINIRVITFGGEGYPKRELKKLYDLYSTRIRFVNVYGPTECTCICSNYDLSDNDFDDLNGLPPLGYINPNFSFIVRNDNAEIDVEGELCLLGPNVGRGYYNNPDTTNKVFCEYTGSGFYRSRMYATGDKVALRNGLLYFMGRIDNQIKHMGYRIELEEIELALNSIKEITQAAVVYQKATSTHGKIVAYVASHQAIDSEYIRDNISDILPSYMIPNTIIVMDQLPKNQNGKVDKTALSSYTAELQTA